MKLISLELERYGRFTDRRLDFPADAQLCMVLGRNEAGKSTAREALCDFLFGFGHKTTFAFTHAMDELRVGGRLKLANGHQGEFRRRKARANTLLDRRDRPLPDQAILPFLAGMDREQFERIFAVDQHRLRQGGEAMLRSDGSMGAVLLEAGEGLRNLVEVQEVLAEQAKKIHAPMAKKTVVAELKHRLDAARRELHERQFLASDHQRVRDALASAALEVEQARKLQSALEAEAQKFHRLALARPALAELDAALAELDALPAVPDLPKDCRERRADLTELLGRKQVVLAELRRESERIAQAIAELPPADPVLQLAAEIAAAAEPRGAVVKARDDRPGRQLELQAAEAALARIAAAFQGDRNSLLESMSATIAQQTVRELALGGKELGALLEQREADLAARRRELAALATAAGSEQSEAAIPPTDPLPWHKRLERLRNPIARAAEVAAHSDALAQRRTALDLACRGLPLVTIGLPELLRATVPGEATLQLFQQRFATLDRGRERLAERREALFAERDGAHRRLDELRAEGIVPTRDEMARARQERDHAWRLLRAHFGLELPGGAEPAVSREAAVQAVLRYERLVAAADELADRRLAEGQRIASFATEWAKWEEAKRQLTELAHISDDIDARATAVGAEWQEAWRAAGIAPLTPAEMIDWLARRAAIGRDHTALLELEAEQEQRARELAEATAGLVRLAAELELALPPGLSLVDLLTLVETALAGRARAWVEAQTRRGQITAVTHALTQAEHECATVRERYKVWQGRWLSALASLALPAAISIEAAQEALRLLADAAAKSRELEGLAYHLRAMEADEAAFAARIDYLGARLGLDARGRDHVETGRELSFRLEQARRAAERRAELDARQEELQSRIAAEETIAARAEAGLTALRAQAGAADEAAMDLVLDRAERKRHLTDELQTVRIRLQPLAEGTNLDDLRAELALLGPDWLVAQRTELASRIAEASASLEAAITRRSDAEAELRVQEGRGGAELAAQAIADSVAGLGAAAAEFARLRATALVLKAAIDRFREREQDPLLHAAGEYLRRLTCGSCIGFAPEFTAKDELHLVVRRKDGQTLGLAGLSEGTRDQLWLALRLAAIERHAELGEPMPFLGDDVFVNFDDERAGDALAALAELGRRCQVLIFTHHPHLLELGSKRLGSAMATLAID